MSTVRIQSDGIGPVHKTVLGVLVFVFALGCSGCDSRSRMIPGSPINTLQTYCPEEFCSQVVALVDELNEGNFMRGAESCKMVFGEIKSTATVEIIGEVLKQDGFEEVDQDGVFRVFNQLRSNHLFEESVPAGRMGIYNLGPVPVMSWKVYQRNVGPRESTTILLDGNEKWFLAANVKGQLVIGLSATKVRLQD